jgi:tetratricopeptide (TPR) repeat protein
LTLKRLIFVSLAATLVVASGIIGRSLSGSRIEIAPSSIPARLVRRDFRAEVADLDSAISALQERAKISRGDWIDQESLTSNWLARARLTGSYDDIVAARAAADKGMAMAIRGSGPLLARAAVSLTSHQLVEAAADLDQVDKFVAPDTTTRAEAKAMRSDIALARGEYSESARLVEEAGRMESWSGLPLRRAMLAYYRGDYARAEEQLVKADALNRTPIPAFKADMLVRQGELDLAQGQWPEAEAHFAEANRIFPGHWRTEMRVAQMKALGGQVDPALREFERIAVARNAPEAMDIAAGLYRAQGNAAESKSWANKAGAIWQTRLRQVPEAAWGHAVEHELAFGAPRRALDLAGKNARNRPHGAPLILLAKAWLANGRADYALALCQKVERSGWVSVDQWLTRAEALVLLGRGKEALDARAEAAKLNPHALERNPAFGWLDH